MRRAGAAAACVFVHDSESSQNVERTQGSFLNNTHRLPKTNRRKYCRVYAPRYNAYILGIPLTSLRGLNTRTARNVRKSKLVPSLLPFFANNVMNLGVKQGRTVSKIMKKCERDIRGQKLSCAYMKK